MVFSSTRNSVLSIGRPCYALSWIQHKQVRRSRIIKKQVGWLVGLCCIHDSIHINIYVAKTKQFFTKECTLKWSGCVSDDPMYKDAFKAKKGLNSHDSSTATKLQRKNIKDYFLMSNFPMDIIHERPRKNC